MDEDVPDPHVAGQLRINDQVLRPATGQYGRVVGTAADGPYVRVVWEPSRPSWHLPSDLQKVEQDYRQEWKP